MNTVTKIAYCNNKKNKTRSVLIMAAIFLSSILLSVICTYAYGLLKFQKVNAEANYGNYHGACSGVGEEELKRLGRRGEIDVIGLMANAGMLGGGLESSFYMADENARRMSNMDDWLEKGEFPGKGREIAAEEAFFQSMGYDGVQIGDTVTLDYRPDLKHKFDPIEFTVSGILNPDRTGESQPGKNVYQVLASQAFCEEQYKAAGLSYSVLFRMQDDVLISFDDAERTVEDIMQMCGIHPKQVALNKPYLLLVLEPGSEVILGCAAASLFVILLSVIVIYNIFQVGIVQNIQEYGKIRAVGATASQMRRLIHCEGLSLAAFSIPSGVAVGYLVAWVSFRWMEKQSVNAGTQVSVSIFSLPMLLLAGFLALLAVLAALRRPRKIVAAVSPAEALRYQESSGNKKAGLRKGTKVVSVASIAAANIAANKRRTLLTVLTMGLSCVMFVMLANCIGNMDAEYDARKNLEHGQFLLKLDYSLDDEAYPENNLDAILKENPLNEGFVSQIRSMEGVTNVRTRDVLSMTVNGRKDDCAVLDEDDFIKRKEQGRGIGTLDYKDGAAENAIYYGWAHFLEEDGRKLGQELTVELENGTDNRTVQGTLKASFPSLWDTGWAVTREMYEELGMEGASVGWVWVDCEPKDADSVRAQLKQAVNGLEHTEMSAYADVLNESKKGMRMLRMACYMFLAVVGLIGFMNLANTMVMDIITKKKEYGVLQAVGMTNRQLNLNMLLQGLVFSAGSIFVSVLVGLPAGYLLFKIGKENSVYGLNVYHIPVAEIVWMSIAIILLQMTLSFFLSRNLKKESLVDRIRY